MNKQLFLFCLLVLGLSSNAQDGHDFDSTYSPLPGLKGTAQYHYYYDIDHLRVKTGEFHFEAHYKDSSWNKTEEEHNWIGNYTENEKSGEWVYEVKSRQLKVDSISDLQIYYDLRTFKSTLTANYKHGIPAKTWTYKSYQKTAPDTWEPYEEVTLTFSQGSVDGPFTYKRFGENGQSVQGHAKKGLFSGQWQLTYTSDSAIVNETREYVNGILLSVEVGANDEREKLDFPHSPQTNAWLQKNSGKGHFTNAPFSLRYNDGYPSISDFITVQKPGEGLLSHMLKLVLRFDKTWVKAHGLPYGVNQGIYPLSESEESSLQNYYHLVDELEELTRNMDRALVLEHASRTDSVYLFAEGWVDVQDRMMDRVANLKQAFLSNRVQYFYRDSLILDYAKDLLDVDSIRVRDSTIPLRYGQGSDTINTFIAFLVSNFSARIELGTQVFEALKRAEKESDIDKELEMIFARIQEERSELDSIRTYDPRVQEFMNTIDHNFLEERIKGQYEVLKQTKKKEKRRELADTIIIELQQIEQIYNLGVKSIAMADYLDSLYTEYVFDAFTFSDNVPARKKKKLYEEVNEVMFELVDLATMSETPRQSLEYVKQIYHIQGVLVYLNDKKTRQIEKDLARARTLEEKIKILNEVV